MKIELVGYYVQFYIAPADFNFDTYSSFPTFLWDTLCYVSEFQYKPIIFEVEIFIKVFLLI